MSSVVFQAGPSEPMTRNLASGRRSPTLMGMARILFDELGNRWGGGANLEHFPARWIPACGGKYDRRAYRSGRRSAGGAGLKDDPEKWATVFGDDTDGSEARSVWTVSEHWS